MKRGLKPAIAALASAISVTALAAGTDNAALSTGQNGQPNRLRVGIVAYCADLYHNAGDTGLQSNKSNINQGSVKQALANIAAGLPVTGEGPQPFLVQNGLRPDLAFLPNLFQDGPFSNLGQYGAQNVADYLAYDDGIDRVRDLRVIDGSFYLPTAQQLAQAFDIVIAFSDNKCGEPIPANIANSAAAALSGFVGTVPPAGLPPKKLILTGFAFSSTLGFANSIYNAGLSPLTKGGPGNAPACSRFGTGCAVGTCPSPCQNVPTASGPECQRVDPATGAATGEICTVYTPTSTTAGGLLVLGTPADANQACREMLNNVRGPTTSSWATALTPANVARGATLCMNYQNNTVDGAPTNVPFLAMNAARNIVAVNSFPPDAHDIQKFWYGCILGDVVQYLSGDTNRCGGGTFCY